MEQAQRILQQVLQQLQTVADRVLADESGRLAVAIAAAAVIGLIVGVFVGRPGKSASGPAKRPAPAAAPAAAKEPVLADRDVSAPGPQAASATGAYRAMLERRGVPEDEISGMVRLFGEQVDGFRESIDKLAGDDSGLREKISEARQALESGDFETTVKVLESISGAHADVARDVRQRSQERFGLSASSQEFIGDLHVALDDFDAAARWYRMAIETMPERPRGALVGCLNKHGTTAYRAGDFIGATASFDRVRKILEKSLGVDHPDVATALNNLALMYYEQGDYAAAEPLYKRALQIDEAALGANHADVATDLNNLALLYMNQGDFQAAEPMFNRSVAIKERNYALGHPSLVTGLRNYAALLRSMGRPEEAATLDARAEAKPGQRIRPAQTAPAQA